MAFSRLLLLWLFVESPAIRRIALFVKIKFNKPILRIASVVIANFYTFSQPRIYTVALQVIRQIVRAIVLIFILISNSVYSQSPVKPLEQALNYEGHGHPIIKVTIIGKDGIPRTTMTRLGFLQLAISYEYRIDHLNDDLINQKIDKLYDEGIHLNKRKAFNNVPLTAYLISEYEGFINSEKLERVLNNYLVSGTNFEEAMKDRNSELWFEELFDHISFLELSESEIDMMFEYLWNNEILVIENHGPWYKVADFTAFKNFMNQR